MSKNFKQKSNKKVRQVNVQARAWCYTVNNWTEEEYEILKETDSIYHIIGKEIGEKCKTPHLQGYIYLKGRGKRETGMKKICPRGIWIICNGTPKENYTYCSKQRISGRKG